MAAVEEEEKIKLFVGQLPKQSSEDELKPMFEAYGPIAEFVILRDKANVSKGCAFLTYVNRSSAMECMTSLHDKHVLPGMPHAIQVKPADSDQKMEERKLFVGMISKSVTEDELRAMFVPFGTVEDVAVLQTGGVSKGCGFVKMGSRASAQRAIEQLHGHTTMEGCRHPIVVKFAETDKEKQQKRGGMGAPFGMTPYMNPMMMYQFAAANQMGNPMMGMGGMGMGGMVAPGAPNPFDLSNAYAGMQQYSAAGMAQQPYQQAAFNGAARPPSKEGGPEGANLFIYHLPPEFNDALLANAFVPFGNVVSAKVFVDKNTNLSKGFGFVSYDNPHSAQTAIQAMNGYQLGHKRLKVELKRSRGQPY